MNAPLSSAEVFTIVLIDYEAWVCDLDARYINGPAWCIQFYLPWIDGFVARSEPWAKQVVPSRSISRHDIALRRTTANGHIPDLPASRQQNRRKLLPTLGFEHRRADIGERDKEFDTEDLESRLGKHIVSDDLPPERSWKVADSVYVFSWTVFTLKASSSASSTSTRKANQQATESLAAKAANDQLETRIRERIGPNKSNSGYATTEQ
jgi:hypothetical protein